MPPPAARKPGTARKNTVIKNNMREEAEGDAVIDAPEPAITAPAKKIGSRKTGAAKKVKEEEANATDEMKNVDQPDANTADDSNPVTAEQDLNHETEGGDGPDGSVTKDKQYGNKGGKKNVAKEKPEPKV